MDPTLIMADTLVRIFVIEGLKMVCWAPVFLAVAYLHARWVRQST